MVAVPGPDSSLCFNCVSFRLSGISSDIPLHPLNYLRRASSRLTSCLLRLRADFHSLLQKMALSAGRQGGFGAGARPQIVMSFLSGSGGQSVPRLLFACGPASWERSELRAVIAGPDRSEVSSDWLLFAHSPGALFLQVSKRDRKWVANEQWCPRLKGTAFKFHYSAAFSESEDSLTRVPFFSPRHKAHFFFFFYWAINQAWRELVFICQGLSFKSAFMFKRQSRQYLHNTQPSHTLP